MNDLINKLQKIIDSEIAPAQAMQFTLGDYDGTKLTVSAPLAVNHNHHGTVFGGSQYAIAAVAGWALLRCKLAEFDLHGAIVVKSAGMDYLRPVASDIFTISVQLDDEDSLQQSMDYFRDNQRANFKIKGEILQGAGVAAVYSAEYAVRG